MHARFALVCGFLVGCVADVATKKPEPLQGDDPAKPAAAECAANPYGACYPTQDIGYGARSKEAWGNRAPNLAFYGKRGGSSDFERITFADQYDPEARHHRVLVVTVATSWCGVCMRLNTEVDAALAAIGTDVKDLDILVEGPKPNANATLDDLDTWIARTHPHHDSVVGSFIDVGAFMPQDDWPLILVIDARSMEIRDAVVGYYASDLWALVTKRVLETRTAPPRP